MVDDRWSSLTRHKGTQVPQERSHFYAHWTCIYNITANANYPQTPYRVDLFAHWYQAPVKPAAFAYPADPAYWYYIAAAAVVAFVDGSVYVFRLRPEEAEGGDRSRVRSVLVDSPSTIL